MLTSKGNTWSFMSTRCGDDGCNDIAMSNDNLLNPNSLPLSVVLLLDRVDLDPTVFHSVRPRKSYSASLVAKLAKSKVNFRRRRNVDTNDNVGDNKN